MLPAIVIVVTVLFLLGVREWRLQPDGRTHVRFLSVGQGDASLITLSDGTTVLVDGGPDFRTLEDLGKFLPFFRRSIDILILSHPNTDHLASFPEILRRYRIREVILSGTEYPLPRYQELLALARAQHVPLRRVVAGNRLVFSGGIIEVLWPPAHLPSALVQDINNASVVFGFVAGERRILFTGDIGNDVENVLGAARANLRADILKVAHHGSRYASSTGFLLAVQPSLAVISVGENSYGHPHPDTLRRLADLKIPLQRTDMSGTVDVAW